MRETTSFGLSGGWCQHRSLVPNKDTKASVRLQVKPQTCAKRVLAVAYLIYFHRALLSIIASIYHIFNA